MAQLVRSPTGRGAPEQRGAVVVELLETRVRITIDPGAERETVAAVLETLAGREGR